MCAMSVYYCFFSSLYFYDFLFFILMGIFLLSSTFDQISNRFKKKNKLIFLFSFFFLFDWYTHVISICVICELIKGYCKNMIKSLINYITTCRGMKKLLLDKYYYFDSILLSLHFFVICVNAKNRGIYSTWAIILLFQACPKICTYYKKE